ncbi:MAG TPA: hypothetical protein VIL04_05335, partial [Solirubrobacterales bacterium]
ARYRAADATALRAALAAGESVTAAALALGPELVRVEPDAAFNVNTPEDLARAERLVSERARPS